MIQEKEMCMAIWSKFKEFIGESCELNQAKVILETWLKTKGILSS